MRQVIEFQKRAVVRQTATATLKRYNARHVPYAVVYVRSLYGLPNYWLAVKRLPNGNEEPLSRHRERGPAERRCSDDLSPQEGKR